VRLLAWACLPLVLGAGCGTTYRPQPTERISVVIRGIAPMYMKSGKATPIMLLDDNLVGLVEDTPAAAEHARVAHRDMTIGAPTYLGGVTALGVGVFFLSGPVGWAVLGAGVLAAGTGLVFLGRGTANVVDAMNIHNDAVDDRLP
jgi:hypothetical protein